MQKELHMIYANQNDETLVSVSLTGNENAYEALVIRYQKAVIGAAYAVTRNHYTAEDAAQDAFVSAWIKLDCLREPSKYGAWVCNIARNCAKNLAARYRDYIDFDLVANSESESNEFFGEYVFASDDNDTLRDSINSLSDKVKKVVILHYFEGLSIAEIADKLRVPIGTVKWRLHEGREKIRKEYGVMNENDELTLVEKVMKKIAQLKNWRLYNKKDGFEAEYNDVMNDIDSMPESEQKNYALSEVLMLGYWFLPGEKNDALIAQLYETAVKGNNQKVIESLVLMEDDKVPDSEKIEFIRDKQIPRLEEAGYTKVVGREWFWLGYEYIRQGDFDAGIAAYNKVPEVLTPSDIYYVTAIGALRMEQAVKDRDHGMYKAIATGEQYRIIDGKLRFWSQPGYSKGNLPTIKASPSSYYYAAFCDSLFYDPDMNVGDVYKAHDGIGTLTFADNNVSVDKFDGCELWIHSRYDYNVKTYYKRSIGIVRSEITIDDKPYIFTLKSYNISGGEGLMPFAVGNRWEYTLDGISPEIYNEENIYEVTSFDGTDAFLWHSAHICRTRWDENVWEDMIMNIRTGYWKYRDGTEPSQTLCDVSFPMARAEVLAVTPIQKVHTRMANSVAARIMATDPEFSPDCTATGHWNFFGYNEVIKYDGGMSLCYDFTNTFEWKDMDGIEVKHDGYPMLFNDIYSILNDAARGFWHDEWTVGSSHTYNIDYYGGKVTTDLKVTAADSITTASGTFDDCILVSLDINNESAPGWTHRTYRQDYYFARGIGIVRAVTYHSETNPAVYDLTAYSGIGDGYMPVENGMTRRYDAIGLKGGYVGSVEYAFCNDDNGKLILLADKTGIKVL